MPSESYKAYIMEGIGTFGLCYIGGMSIALSPDDETVVPALAHMLALGIMIYVGAATSGGHYNPAVSIALLLTRNMQCKDFPWYILAQFLGGFLGGLLVWGLTADLPGGADKYCKTYPGIRSMALKDPNIKDHVAIIYQACVAEYIGTFFLVFMLFATAKNKDAPKGLYGFAISGTVAMAILGIGNISGAALNTMRWMGPYFVGLWGCGKDGSSLKNYSGWSWLPYVVFTNLGGITAALVGSCLFQKPTK